MQIVFPNCNGQGTNQTLEINNNVVIIGANGAGKSRMGGFIQKLNPNVYRISAQRLLNIKDNVNMQPQQQAEQELFRNIKETTIEQAHGFLQTTLSLLFADQSSIAIEYFNKSKLNPLKEPIIKTKIDILLEIWNNILPYKKISLTNYTITTITPKHPTISMSDGEKVCLYMIGQCLCFPAQSVIVVDEPEIHIHKALLSKLWTQIEEKRPDCQFIYITHDLDFATSRANAKKIWVREYKGNNQWIWEEVPEKEEIPEELMLKIFGSRKPILFVEGEKGKSLDLPIYEAIYPEFTIIPRNSCSKVIEGTKAMQDNETLHTNKVYGLIDRDYRTEEEINALTKLGISFLEVAEVENLFCVPEIVAIVAENQCLNVEEIKDKINKFIISQLEQHLEREVSFRSSLEINFRLNSFNQKVQGKEALKQEVQRHANSIDVDSIYEENRRIYQEIIDTKDVIRALKFYINKGLLPQMGQFFNLHKDYSSLVIRLLKGNKKNQIVEALKKYLPTINQNLNATI